MKKLLLLSLSMLVAAVAQAQSLTISTLAGNAGHRSVDGTGTNARFNNPWGVAVDANGNVYVVDTDSDVIRKVTSSGVATTIAGSAGVSGSTDATGSNARFNLPQGVAVDAAGNLYITDSGNHTIRCITSAGVVTTIAGTAGVSGTSDGSGSAALFNNPEGIALNPAGTALYVADTWNHTIRLVGTNGAVTTFAGTAGTPGSNDGNGTSASFSSPSGVAVDASGNIYVADTGNQIIRLITSGGTVTTIAGVASSSGTTDGSALSALFSDPTGIAVDSSGNVYVADAFNNTIRKIASGNVTTPVGTAGVFGSSDGTGSAAQFWQPQGLAVDSSGKVYVADSANGTVRKVSGTSVSTLAGLGTIGTTNGPGGKAQFTFPAGTSIDDSGTTYVADTFNHTIRSITTAGVVTSFAGSAGVSGSADGNGSTARFNSPQGMDRDASGNIYVADTANHTIRKITSGGSVSLFAGSAGTNGWLDGSGSAALFNYPQDVAVDGAGNVYVADTWNHVIRKITSGGAVATLAGQGQTYGDSDGTGDAVGTNIARFYAPGGVTVDTSGNVYVADTHNHTIREITPSGVVSTLAGLAGSYGSVDGTSNNARFFLPQAIVVDSSGNLYVLDSGNQTIRKMTQSGGVWTVTTVAGNTSVAGSSDGAGSAAEFFNPIGLSINSSGTLAIADTANNTIRSSGVVSPTILTSPVSETVAQAQDAIFNVTAWGSTLTYQWYFNGGQISGATDSSYTKSNVETSDNGSYSVIAMNTAGSATSSSAVLSVVVPPSISTQPQSQTIGVGTNATLTVQTTGTLPSYQWQKNGVNIGGATTSALSLNSISHSDDASYTVVVSNLAAAVTSDVATLTVMDLPVITAQPVSTTVNQTSNAVFSVGATGSSLSYQWRKAGQSIGAATDSTFTILNASSSDEAAYDVVVFNAIGSFTSSAASLTVIVAPAITTQPQSQTVGVGTNVLFTTAAFGTSPVFQWQQNGADIPGATGTNLSLASVSHAAAASYSVVASNAAGTATSQVATLTVLDPPVITLQPASTNAAEGASAEFDVSATGSSVSYQWRKAGQTIAGQTTASLSLANLTMSDNDTYDVVVFNEVGSVTSSPATLTVIIAPNITADPQSQTVATGTNVVLGVTASGNPLYYQWRKDGADIPEATDSALSLPNVSHADAAAYTVVVTNTAGSVTSGAATLTVVDPPVITQQPSSATANESDNVAFDVTATGESLAYQWRKDGVEIPGATTSHLALSTVTTNDTGNYDVVVTNVVGSLTSTPASLNVFAGCHIFTLSALPDGNFGTNYNATITTTGGTGPYSYFIADGSVPAGLSFETNGTISGMPFAIGASTFTVIASDVFGCTGTNVYTLLIAPSGSSLDTTKPAFAIKTPKNKAVSTTSTITVAGTAADSSGTKRTGVALVLYSLNGGDQQLAGTGNKFTNWTADITLQSGWNTFVGCAYDYRGNASTAITNLYFYGNTNAIIGSYNGLFYETNNLAEPVIAEQSAGALLNFNVQFIGTYSGKLRLQGTNLNLKGQFDFAGNTSTNLPRGIKPPLQVSLHLDWTGATKQITGTVACADEGWTAPLVADLKVFNTKNNPHNVARYTMAIAPAANAPDNSPGGYSYGTINVNASGIAAFSGVLADTATMSESIALSKDERCPLYVSLYKDQGLIEGWIDFSSGTPTGTVTWIKPTAPAGIKLTTYPNGFTNVVSLFGSAYAQIAPGITPVDNVIDITDASGLNLPLTLNASVSSLNSIVRLSPTTNSLSGSIKTSTGLITVNFRPTGVGAISKTAKGVVIQGSNTAVGFFVGNRDSITGKTNTGAIFLH